MTWKQLKDAIDELTETEQQQKVNCIHIGDKQSSAFVRSNGIIQIVPNTFLHDEVLFKERV
jgi:hypothetical protein